MDRKRKIILFMKTTYNDIVMMLTFGMFFV